MKISNALYMIAFGLATTSCNGLVGLGDGIDNKIDEFSSEAVSEVRQDLVHLIDGDSLSACFLVDSEEVSKRAKDLDALAKP